MKSLEGWCRGVMDCPGKGRGKPCDWAALRRRLSVGVSGYLGKGAAPRPQVGAGHPFGSGTNSCQSLAGCGGRGLGLGCGGSKASLGGCPAFWRVGWGACCRGKNGLAVLKAPMEPLGSRRTG